MATPSALQLGRVSSKPAGQPCLTHRPSARRSVSTCTVRSSPLPGGLLPLTHAPWVSSPKLKARTNRLVAKSAKGKVVEEIIDESGEPEEPTYDLKYLYDGGCTVCMSLVTMLKSRRGHEGIYFEDISDPNYSPRRNKGIEYSDAMDTIHVITKGGDILLGMDALTALYTQVGLGWVFMLARLPILNKIAEFIYRLISKNRIAMGGGMDAIMAVGRINMEKEGTGTCEEGGECRAKEEPEPEPEAEEEDEEPPIVGSWTDKQNVLGIYTFGKGAGLRAAPIDSKTGQFLVPGRSIRLESHDFETLITAIDKLINMFQWKGVIGLGLPNLLSDRDANEWMSVDLQERTVDMTVGRSKMEFQEELKTACNHDVIVMNGAECVGYGELAYGAGKDLDGLVMIVTMGSRVTAALFDNGVHVRNLTGVIGNVLESWDSPKWADTHQPSENDEDKAKWDMWGERCQEYVLKLEELMHPDHIIIGGSASMPGRFKKLQPRLSKIDTPILRAELGQLGGVKGAAVGAAFQLNVRDKMAEMRIAMSRYWSKSPAAMTETDLRKAFDRIDADQSGGLAPCEVAQAFKDMGVDLPVSEITDIVYGMDTDADGTVDFSEFRDFWATLAASQPVTLIHTLAEYENILAEEGNSGRLIVLEVGFTYCKPCRAFEPVFHGFAEHFSNARFIRCNGNENCDMVKLGRDILKVRSSPSFYLIRNQEVIHSWTGAREAKFEDAVLQNLLPEEAGYVADYQPKTAEELEELHQAARAAKAAAVAAN